jgi:hypothetical protein
MKPPVVSTAPRALRWVLKLARVRPTLLIALLCTAGASGLLGGGLGGGGEQVVESGAGHRRSQVVAMVAAVSEQGGSDEVQAVLADVDGDGVPDLITAGSSGSLGFSKGRGDETLGWGPARGRG